MTAAPAGPGQDRAPSGGRRLLWAGLATGFALGGFFDGILLHQILQWHHLLSGVDGAAFADLRLQILADGLFHALMYVIGLVGLWLLWRARSAFALPGAGRRVAAWALIGFGIWHVVDGIVSHWVLGIHRIRMDSPQPLLWDLLWLAVFGVGGLLAGAVLLRHRPGGDGGISAGRRGAMPLTLGLLLLVAAPVAALPPPSGGPVIVLFGPGVSTLQVFAVMAELDAQVVWSDPSGQIWAIEMASDGDAARLYRHGAWLVGDGTLPLGCFGWSRA